ncbi:DUF4280 domain-containing protein [Sphingomonas pokkalii]|uniref:DUF4280 domain-containing protein n=1 Tax=Sphingomonas pokkalii TaxID=2175090 RepID=A0A2U0SFJ5_9SPHN|nr:DUF4280 domain-containing protein [Sphingomonas pokkalii]PVX30084.1 DUF4280 domain-containing protein [Sphingomonas pokkalii]
MTTPQVTSGTLLKCSFGSVPTALVVLPDLGVTASALPAATVLDNKAMINVPSFGMCSSIANPAVAAATAAAMGSLTPMPCVPVLAAPWTPGVPKVTIGGMAALDTKCTLMCSWLGTIEVSMPAQATVTVP